MIERAHAAQKVFSEWEGIPFEWGKTDCARLVARLAEVVTSQNPMNDWPEYSSEQQARKVIRSKGHKSLVQAVDVYAQRLEGPLFAIAGDIVGIDSGKKRMPALGICLGPDAVLCFGPDVDEKGQAIPGTTRARRLDMQMAIYAWRIA